jgi:hypothetical protein
MSQTPSTNVSSEAVREVPVEEVSTLLRDTCREVVDLWSDRSSRTCQPKWILVHEEFCDEGAEATLVIQDLTEVYDPMCIRLSRQVNGTVKMYEFPVPRHFRCIHDPRHVGTNTFHPDSPEWYSTAQGWEGLRIEDLLSPNAVRRALALCDIADYHGLENFDSYPKEYTSKASMKTHVNEIVKARNISARGTEDGYQYTEHNPIETCFDDSMHNPPATHVSLRRSAAKSVLSITGPLPFLLVNYADGFYPAIDQKAIIKHARSLLTGYSLPDALSPLYPYAVTISVDVRPLLFIAGASCFKCGTAAGGNDALRFSAGVHPIDQKTGWIQLDRSGRKVETDWELISPIIQQAEACGDDETRLAQLYALIIAAYLSCQQGIDQLPGVLKTINRGGTEPIDMSVCNALFSWKSIACMIWSLTRSITPVDMAMFGDDAAE